MMFIDSFAWIEYFMGTERGRKVKKIIEGNVITYTSPTVIAEIFSKSVRTDGQDKARERADFIVDRCVLIQTDENIAVEAGRLHGEMKPKARDFGLADAFILASARSKGAKVVTGDPHFKDLDDTVFLD